VAKTRTRYAVASPDDGRRIDLRNPFLAALLSWLVPGLGQLYQRRTLKGGMCMAALVAALVFGMWLGDGRVVYAAGRPGELRLPPAAVRAAFIGQAGIGVVAIPAFVQSRLLAGSGSEPLFASAWFAPPVQPGQFVSPAYAETLARTSPGVAVADSGPGRRFRQVLTDELSVWQKRLGRRFEIGTLYTVIAGLLNLLVVFDALGGPMRGAGEKSAPAEGGKRHPPPAGERR
jgi:hypothetical protein